MRKALEMALALLIVLCTHPQNTLCRGRLFATGTDGPTLTSQKITEGCVAVADSQSAEDNLLRVPNPGALAVA